MRCALYARSATKENGADSSCQRQLRQLRDRAGAQGWEIVASFDDEGFAGTNLLRPGAKLLIAAIRDREFDILLTESLDRLSRDQADIMALVERCRRNQIHVVTLLEGEIFEPKLGPKITVAGLFLRDLQMRFNRALSAETGGQS